MKILKYILFLVFIVIGNIQSQNKLDVFIMISEECPICKFMTSEIRTLNDTYHERINFHLVFVKINASEISAQKFLKKHKLIDIDVIIDGDQTLCKKLGATVTPEAIVVNEQGETLYRGRISNAYYAPGKMRRSGVEHDLDLALKYILQNREVYLPWHDAVGCYITFQ